MFVTDDRVIYSASDLAAAARCEYALLRSFDAKLGRGPQLEVEEDDMLARTAELGDEHERRTLDELTARHGDGVVRIGRPSYTLAAFRAAARATAEAFERRPAVVYQAALLDGRFVGLADFVVLDGDRYQVLDTKLARHAKIEALLQIAGYADALRTIGVPVAPTAGLILGNQSMVEYPVDDLIPVYRQQRDQLQALLDNHLASGEPVAWADPSVRACMRCEFCVPNVVDDDDLLRVAGMRMTQRDTLMGQHIGTVADLAASTGTVDGMAASTVAILTRAGTAADRAGLDGKPAYEVADPQPLTLLPDPDKGDLFFDFEGDPLWSADGRQWGLEYLWGVLDGAGSFLPLWAHDRAGERQALVEFLAMVRNVAGATRRCTSTTTPPTRRPHCCASPPIMASVRTMSTIC